MEGSNGLEGSRLKEGNLYDINPEKIHKWDPSIIINIFPETKGEEVERRDYKLK